MNDLQKAAADQLLGWSYRMTADIRDPSKREDDARELRILALNVLILQECPWQSFYTGLFRAEILARSPAEIRRREAELGLAP